MLCANLLSRMFDSYVQITLHMLKACTKFYSFNATLMLETLRGKRMMFVGDSLNRGQYVSMICLLHSLIPDEAKSMETFDSDSRTVFTAKVTFHWIFIFCLLICTITSILLDWFFITNFRITMPQLSSIGRHFFLSRTRIMLSTIGYRIGLSGKGPWITMANTGRGLMYWCSIPICGGWPARNLRSCIFFTPSYQIIKK